MADEQRMEQTGFIKADYNLGEREFTTIQNLLNDANTCSQHVLAYSDNMDYARYLDLYYSTLKTLYNAYIRPKINQDFITEFDAAFNYAEGCRINLMQEQLASEDVITHPTIYIKCLEQIHQQLSCLLMPLGLSYSTMKSDKTKEGEIVQW